MTLGPAVGDFADAVSLAAGAVLVDLAEVTYIDSAGIGQLIGSMKAVTGTGRKFGLLRVNARVQGLMKLTGVNSLFQFFNSEESALAAFEKLG